MRKRLTSLSFIIGLFFFLIALVLLIGYVTSALLAADINLYSGIVFLAFGIFMIMLPYKEE